jgi:hypothetical protein
MAWGQLDNEVEEKVKAERALISSDSEGWKQAKDLESAGTEDIETTKAVREREILCSLSDRHKQWEQNCHRIVKDENK